MSPGRRRDRRLKDHGNPLWETAWLGDLPVAVLSPAGRFYIAPDHLGAPHLLTGPGVGGAVAWQWNHDPFGNGGPVGSFSYDLRFPGQYFDQATRLHYNYFRDYDPRTGRYIESDPIGLAGGINTYAYADGNPLASTDASGLGPGQLDPLSEDCQALAKKIDDIRKDLEKRKREYEENPGNLPESVPGGKPRDSREGHLKIINELKQILARRLREYAEKCGGGGEGGGGGQCPSN